MEKSFNEMHRYEKARKRVDALKGFYRHLTAYIVVNLIIVLMKWYNLEQGESLFTLSTFIIAIWWGVTIVFHAIGVFGKSFSLGRKWEERKLQEYMEIEERKRKWQ